MASLIGRTLLSRSKSVPRILSTIGGRIYSPNLPQPQRGLCIWASETGKAPGEIMPLDPDTPIIRRRGVTCSSATHWHIAMELPKPEREMKRDEIVDHYLNTLAKVLGGSKEEAKKKMFSVSTRHYYFFVCNVCAEISDRLWELPEVSGVRPLSEADVKGADFARTGEPFVNGEVVPYDPKYHVGVLALMNGPAGPSKRPNYKPEDQIRAVMNNRNRRARWEEEKRQNF